MRLVNLLKTFSGLRHTKLDTTFELFFQNSYKNTLRKKSVKSPLSGGWGVKTKSN